MTSAASAVCHDGRSNLLDALFRDPRRMVGNLPDLRSHPKYWRVIPSATACISLRHSRQSPTLTGPISGVIQRRSSRDFLVRETLVVFSQRRLLLLDSLVRS